MRPFLLQTAAGKTEKDRGRKAPLFKIQDNKPCQRLFIVQLTLAPNGLLI